MTVLIPVDMNLIKGELYLQDNSRAEGENLYIARPFTPDFPVTRSQENHKAPWFCGGGFMGNFVPNSGVISFEDIMGWEIWKCAELHDDMPSYRVEDHLLMVVKLQKISDWVEIYRKSEGGRSLTADDWATGGIAPSIVKAFHSAFYHWQATNIPYITSPREG